MEFANRKRILLKCYEELKQLECKAKEYQNYEESTRLMNEMVINVRTLLYRTKLIKEDIEHTNEQGGIAALQSKLEQYRKFQKSLLIPFFSPAQLDQSMAGAFVMRMYREMSYWAPVLMFVGVLIEQIDQLFCQQKSIGQFNIELIYFFAIKKINAKADQLIKMLHENLLSLLAEESSEEDTHKFDSQAFLDPISMLAIERDRNLAKMEEMRQFMNKWINKLYSGLQIVNFDPILSYKVEMTQDYNISCLFKKQLRRNRQLKRTLQSFRNYYLAFKKKRQKRVKSYAKLQDIKSKFTRANSTLKKSSMKSLASLKSLANKQAKRANLKFPVLAPSKLNKQKSNVVSLMISPSKSRGNSWLSGSKEKDKVVKWQRKENILLPKHNRLKL